MSEIVELDLESEFVAYALGLWCADGYWWSSSIGLSNTRPELILRFGEFLLTVLPRERLRLRVYTVPGSRPSAHVISSCNEDQVRFVNGYKMKRTAYHLYVNSRPLLRAIVKARASLSGSPPAELAAYFAGRYDGDGSWGSTPRIAYTTKEEAQVDRMLLARADFGDTSLLHYAAAGEYCIYFRKAIQERFRYWIGPHSLKLE